MQWTVGNKLAKVPTAFSPPAPISEKTAGNKPRRQSRRFDEVLGLTPPPATIAIIALIGWSFVETLIDTIIS